MDSEHYEVLLHKAHPARPKEPRANLVLSDDSVGVSAAKEVQGSLAYVTLFLQRPGEDLQLALADGRRVEREAEGSLPPAPHQVVLQQDQVRKELQRHLDQL